MASTKIAGYPFAEKTRYYRQLTDAALSWSAKDAREARDAMRGHDPVAEGWYSDDLSTIQAEISRRAAGVLQNEISCCAWCTNPAVRRVLVKTDAGVSIRVNICRTHG